MFSLRTMKQKTRVMLLTLIGAILLGLAVGLLPIDEHSANAAPKGGHGDKGDKGGKSGKAPPMAHVAIFRIEDDCEAMTVWTNWDNIKQIARVEIDITKDDLPLPFVFEPDEGHPFVSLETAVFTRNATSRFAPIGADTYQLTETRFYNKRNKLIERFTPDTTPPLTGKIDPIWNKNCPSE